MSLPLICRRVEDTTADLVPFSKATCSRCQKEVYVEGGDEGVEPKVCLPCTVEAAPNSLVFVQTPPDGYGPQFISVSAQQVYEKDGGEWHKGGAWYSQQWVFRNQD